MLDKNGKEIKTGMIVKVSNSYFKTDNGLYFVERSPGDPTWLGTDYSLHKICRNGKISTTKYRICFWPIKTFVSNYDKNVRAKEWNREHAEIEIVSLPNMSEVKAYFQAAADEFNEPIKRAEWHDGENNERLKMMKANQAFFASVAAAI